MGVFHIFLFYFLSDKMSVSSVQGEPCLHPKIVLIRSSPPMTLSAGQAVIEDGWMLVYCLLSACVCVQFPGFEFVCVSFGAKGQS